MKNLLEISKIVTKKKVKKIEIFDEHSLRLKNSKFNEFYEALSSGKLKNDRDASQLLYNCGPTDDKYRQLKSRFRKRLMNTLFFLDVNTPGTSSYNRAYYTVNKDWTLVQILITNNAPYTASAMARHILTIALKFKFADVIVNCSRILRRFCALTNDEKEYEEYDQYAKQYGDILAAEIRSEELYQRVVMNYHKPLMKNSELHEKIDTYCDALVGLSEMYDSPVINYTMYMVWAFRYEMLSDYQGVLEVCNRAEKYISDHPIYHRDDILAELQLKEMSAYLHLKDFRNGKANAEKCIESFPEGTDTWFNIMEFYFLLSMHTGHYANALAVFNQTVAQPKFKRLATFDKEKWNVYEAYLNFVLEIKAEANPVLMGQDTKGFKQSKFLSENISYPKDQRMFTVLMLSAQVLFLIEKKQFNAASEKIERLKGIANRHLKKEEHMRAILFIRLLQQAARVNFKPDSLHAESKYIDRLSDYPFKYRGIVEELEVVPYEKLWEMVLSRLKK